MWRRRRQLLRALVGANITVWRRERGRPKRTRPTAPARQLAKRLALRKAVRPRATAVSCAWAAWLDGLQQLPVDGEWRWPVSLKLTASSLQLTASNLQRSSEWAVSKARRTRGETTRGRTENRGRREQRRARRAKDFKFFLPQV